MENQHRKIKGYNELSQEDIDLINKVKLQGAVLKALIDEVKARVNAKVKDAAPEQLAVLEEAEPYRWIAMARTDLQTGLMRLTRGVAQPSFF